MDWQAVTRTLLGNVIVGSLTAMPQNSFVGRQQLWELLRDKIWNDNHPDPASLQFLLAFKCLMSILWSWNWDGLTTMRQICSLLYSGLSSLPLSPSGLWERINWVGKGSVTLEAPWGLFVYALTATTSTFYLNNELILFKRRSFSKFMGFDF